MDGGSETAKLILTLKNFIQWLFNFEFLEVVGVVLISVAEDEGGVVPLFIPRIPVIQFWAHPLYVGVAAEDWVFVGFDQHHRFIFEIAITVEVWWEEAISGASVEEF